ncbi:septum formation inhibitor Maf [Candidatus Kaiserbacteria bacterium]|nr:septum formation inhibitor Maf [Candidatus Kaiserbacteria bacterium]
MNRKIVLASTSARRKELLERVGLVFEVVGSDYEEDMTLVLSPAELAKYLSQGKAEAVAQKYPDAIVIAADTFICYEGKILGKPYTPEKARETLHTLSGKAHSVITGFTIVETKTGESISEAVETKVYFRDLSDQEIDDYIATGEPLERAGAYAIQGIGKDLVDHVEGDYDNVVGLPVAAVLHALKDFE